MKQWFKYSIPYTLNLSSIWPVDNQMEGVDWQVIVYKFKTGLRGPVVKSADS